MYLTQAAKTAAEVATAEAQAVREAEAKATIARKELAARNADASATEIGCANEEAVAVAAEGGRGVKRHRANAGKIKKVRGSDFL